MNAERHWISANAKTPVIYHTNEDCPYYPDDVRGVSEQDIARGIRECQWCKFRGAHWLQGIGQNGTAGTGLEVSDGN